MENCNVSSGSVGLESARLTNDIQHTIVPGLSITFEVGECIAHTIAVYVYGPVYSLICDILTLDIHQQTCV